MNPTRKAFILGGTGQIGRAVAERLILAGWRVTLARALDPGVDALIDVTAYGPEHARQLLDVQRSVGTFVVISSCSVYRDESGKTLDEAAAAGFPELPEPITEAQMTVAPGPATYSTRKIALERMLLDEATKPVIILRPAAIHGPGSNHPREWWFVKRMMDGRQVIPIAYRGESRFHTSATANIAELTRVALDAPGSRILNIADPLALSVGEIGETIAKYMKYSGKFIRLDGDTFPAKVGQTPWSVPLPFVLDTSAAAALGYVPVTTYAQAVGATCDELAEFPVELDWRARFPALASYPYDHFDYDAEDAFLSAMR
jgi:nucleoside-diphosphate-sugar epimerase